MIHKGPDQWDMPPTGGQAEGDNHIPDSPNDPGKGIGQNVKKSQENGITTTRGQISDLTKEPIPDDEWSSSVKTQLFAVITSETNDDYDAEGNLILREVVGETAAKNPAENAFEIPQTNSYEEVLSPAEKKLALISNYVDKKETKATIINHRELNGHVLALVQTGVKQSKAIKLILQTEDEMHFMEGDGDELQQFFVNCEGVSEFYKKMAEPGSELSLEDLEDDVAFWTAQPTDATMRVPAGRAVPAPIEFEDPVTPPNGHTVQILMDELANELGKQIDHLDAAAMNAKAHELEDVGHQDEISEKIVRLQEWVNHHHYEYQFPNVPKVIDDGNLIAMIKNENPAKEAIHIGLVMQTTEGTLRFAGHFGFDIDPDDLKRVYDTTTSRESFKKHSRKMWFLKKLQAEQEEKYAAGTIDYRVLDDGNLLAIVKGIPHSHIYGMSGGNLELTSRLILCTQEAVVEFGQNADPDAVTKAAEMLFNHKTHITDAKSFMKGSVGIEKKYPQKNTNNGQNPLANEGQGSNM